MINNIGWQFDNSYARLPECFYTLLKPTTVQDPRPIIINHALASELVLNLESENEPILAQLFSGNQIPESAKPLAQAYAGHQFGHFAMLGDGRAHLLGEHLTPDGRRVDIQFKGSGRTPYARRGDGRAALGPMLREYIISEAMHALNIPTTRSLAVVTTGEPVYRETMLQGAILTRVASSHVRVGTFEYAASLEGVDALKTLADYVIDRHYPELTASKQPYLDLIQTVMDRQIALVVHWLRVGFIHGVMNTDNMTISGETIDYGPCAFMDHYDPQTVFSAIDETGRYAYANQPRIAEWNLARLAETLLPLLHDDNKQAVSLAQQAMQPYNKRFQYAWLAMMRCKLGLFGEEKNDAALIGDLLAWMQRSNADYTNLFRDLISDILPEGEQYEHSTFSQWWERWQQRLMQNGRLLDDAWDLMRTNNPAIIPRNHRVEEVLAASEGHADFSKLHTLLDVLSDPYTEKPEHKKYTQPSRPEERVYQTFCGT